MKSKVFDQGTLCFQVFRSEPWARGNSVQNHVLNVIATRSGCAAWTSSMSCLFKSSSASLVSTGFELLFRVRLHKLGSQIPMSVATKVAFTEAITSGRFRTHDTHLAKSACARILSPCCLGRCDLSSEVSFFGGTMANSKDLGAMTRWSNEVRTQKLI